MRILSTPPHAAGDWTSGWKGWWFFFRVSSGTLGADARALGHLDGGVDGRVFPLFLGRSWRFGGVRPFRPFQVSVGEVLRFEDVGIFAFSGMLDFEMFGCWWIVTSNAFVLGW